MNIQQVLKPAFKKLTLTAAIGLLCLGSVPQNSFAHGYAPSPPSSPGSRPPPRPIIPMNIQTLRDRLDTRNIKLSQEEWDRLEGYDENRLGVVDRSLEYLYGLNNNLLTPEQRENILNWLINTLDRSGENQNTMWWAELYNSNAYIAENIGTVLSITKGGIIIVAAVTNPALLPVIISIEATATKAEIAATGIGEFSAALQGGVTKENITCGLTKAGLAVTIKLASGATASLFIPPGKIGEKVLHNLTGATQEALQDAALAWIGEEFTKTGLAAGGKAIAQNLLEKGPTKVVDPTKPVWSTSDEITFTPEQLAEMEKRVKENALPTPSTTSNQPAPAETGEDDVGQLIQGLLDSRELKPSAVQTNTVPVSDDDLQLFSNIPTLPAPTPATPGVPSDTSDLFVNHFPQGLGAEP